jgi:hypothetical protein
MPTRGQGLGARIARGARNIVSRLTGGRIGGQRGGSGGARTGRS